MLVAFFFAAISGLVYLRSENIQAFNVYYTKTYSIRQVLDFSYYAKDFINGIGPFMLCLTLPLLLNYLVHFKKREKILFIWLFVPLILFSLSPNKSLRFLLPAFPAFALIVSGEITSRRWSRSFRTGYIVSILFVALFQYYLVNTGLLTLMNSNSRERGVLSIQKDKYASARTAIFNILVQEHNLASKKNRAQQKNIRCLFFIGEIYWPLRIHILLHQLPYAIYCDTELDQADITNAGYRKVDWGEKILSAEYILEKSGNKEIPSYVKFIEDEQRRVFDENLGRFEVIGSFPIDDGTLYIYRRKK